MKIRHGNLPRGLDVEAVNKEVSGPPAPWSARFGRMFPDLEAATYGGGTHGDQLDKLHKLAKAMIAGFDEPKDGPDPEESAIPALYTYFGQFIDHDLTFDPDGSFQKQKDPHATVDFRTPAFDLDNVYGRGPGDQPFMYDEDGKSFLLGEPLTLGLPNARDLPRNSQGRALIGDPRNDENAIVSQLQGLFLRFHNRVVQDHQSLHFEQVQEHVRKHYQYVVVNDFLAQIVHKDVLESLKTGGVYDPAKLQFFKQQEFPFMPVEFSVAAYRLGHSMVRAGYRLNAATLVPIFPNPPKSKSEFPEGLTGFRRMISDWGIDWGRLIDVDVRPYQGVDGDKGVRDNQRRLQFAYRIDTSMVDPLSNLPIVIAGRPPLSLALRNLERGLEFGLPSGQKVAEALGVPVLDDAKILIGQGTNIPDEKAKAIVDIDPIFAGNCPLWTYVLAEAMNHMITSPLPVTIPDGVTPEDAKVSGGVATNTTPQLGPVGGRIVAEVFLGLMFSDSGSYLSTNPHWHPASGKNYKLKDFVNHALGH